MLVSLDGYVSDDQGRFEWAVPDEELHAFINEQASAIGTSLLGRRMYETMSVWETAESVPGITATELAYADIWRGYDKVVFSSTLNEVSSARTRIERSFDPGAVRAMVRDSPLDVAIDGPTLAAQALQARIVDGVSLYVCPVVVGRGLPFFPPGFSADLQLLNERRFEAGVVWASYAIKEAAGH
jgi:dihydrofolate reductase